jgi:hypothetical protein
MGMTPEHCRHSQLQERPGLDKAGPDKLIHCLAKALFWTICKQSRRSGQHFLHLRDNGSIAQM